MASSKQIQRSVSADVNKALSNIGSMKPDMKGGDTELKSAVAPKKAETFAEAFRAARKDPEAMKRGTFTWGGKSYTTKTAGEGPKRSGTASVKPAATAAKASASTAKPPVGSRANPFPANKKEDIVVTGKSTPAKPATTGTKPATTGTKPATTGTKPARPKDNVVTGREALSSWWNRNMGELRTASARARASDAAKQAKAKADKAARDKKRSSYNAIGSSKAGIAAAAAANKRYAKGGSVDGCAVRGKTRAPMKKGK